MSLHLQHPRSTQKTADIIRQEAIRLLAEKYPGNRLVVKRVAGNGIDGIDVISHGNARIYTIPLYDDLNSYPMPYLKSLVFEKFLDGIAGEMKIRHVPTPASCGQPAQASRSRSTFEGMYKMALKEVDSFIERVNVQAKHGPYTSDVEAGISSRKPDIISVSIFIRGPSWNGQVHTDVPVTTGAAFRGAIRDALVKYARSNVM